MARRLSGGLKLLLARRNFRRVFVLGFALSSGLRWLVCVVTAAGLGLAALVRTIAMIVTLLGVGKRALDRLLAAFVDRLAPGRQAVGIGALAGGQQRAVAIAGSER